MEASFVHDNSPVIYYVNSEGANTSLFEGLHTLVNCYGLLLVGLLLTLVADLK